MYIYPLFSFIFSHNILPCKEITLACLDPSNFTKPKMTKSGYIDAAFRSSRNNEAYFFMNDKYILLDYAPGTGNDKILYGPSLVRDGFRSLAHTIFGSYGIDCSFNTDNNEAFIFYENFCALIDYAPYSGNVKIISGPKKIADMFPFFKGTMFEKGVDAAFRSTKGK